jgi:hypothetical protein
MHRSSGHQGGNHAEVTQEKLLMWHHLLSLMLVSIVDDSPESTRHDNSVLIGMPNQAKVL